MDSKTTKQPTVSFSKSYTQNKYPKHPSSSLNISSETKTSLLSVSTLPMHSSSGRSSCFIAGDDEDDGFSTSSAISIPSPLRSFNGRQYEARCVYRQPHFLQTCAFCKKSIGDDMDIFMYRGDTPFCSEECRQEQIDVDEASEKKLKMSSSSMKSRSASKALNCSVRSGTVAAA